MIALRRSRWCVLLALLVVGLRAEPTLAPTAAPDPAGLPAPAAGTEVLWVKPYLQAVGADRATLRFETRAATAVHVTLTPATPGAVGTSVEEPARRFHAVTATGLAAQTAYRFTISSDGQELGSAALVTWPAAPKTIKFFAYGDTRTRPLEHAKICNAMVKRAEGHLFVLHSGDLVANGRTYGLWRKEFFDPAAELLARLPLYAVPGNHEGESGFYADYFSLPDLVWQWAFDVGPVHVLGLDNFRDFDKQGWERTASGKWLLAKLPEVRAPWRVAMFHSPIYSLGTHGVQDDAGAPKEPAMRWSRNTLEPLLRKHGYTLTINGHDHLYERSFKDGLLMVTSGGGGAPLYKPKDGKQNPWSQKVVSTTHFMDITASEDRLDVTVLNGDGETIDAFAVTRDAAGKAVVTAK